jgi:hypothetical protein
MSMAISWSGHVQAGWDGEPSLDEIEFNLESFIDINSYQFRPSEEIRWYGVENGLRVAAGSLETNRLYLMTDLRLKQSITPSLTARMWLADEELYEPREFPRPLFELELQPTPLPVSLSLIGTPAYAKRDADLGLAATLGRRPWNFLRIAWLSPDHYFNDKNDLDDDYYRQEPSQLTLEAAYQWADRYKFRLLVQDNSRLEYVLDEQLAVFSYENRNYRLSFDFRSDTRDHYGIVLRGLETDQALAEGVPPHSQDIAYFSIDTYWFRQLDQRDEWTLGLRYDDFTNDERTLTDPMASFDFTYRVVQVYTSYYRILRENHALELGLYLGYASQEQDYLDTTIPDEDEDRIEAKLRPAWELFSTDGKSALSISASLNLDELGSDPFDGGSVRLRTEF